MTNDDQILIKSIQCHSTRLDKEEHKCQAELSLLMLRPQISDPIKEVSPEVYQEYFKYASKLAEKFPDWSVIDYMMTTHGYSVDGFGYVTHDFGQKVEYHPLIRAAKLAPDEFREFAVASLASTHGEDIMGILFKNQEAFGLKNEDLSDLLHQALEKKDQLAKEIFCRIMSDDHEDLRKDFITRYPQDFGKIVKAAAKGRVGYDALLAMGDGEARPVAPEIQEWIDKNPKIYGEIVQTAVCDHCVHYPEYKQKGQFDEIMALVNKDFLAKHPDFIAQSEQKMQQAIIRHNQQNKGERDI